MGTSRFRSSPLAVLITAVVAITVVFAAPAAAQSTSLDDPGGPTPVDGCTAVPDSGPGFDFTEACNDHDRCYYERPYGDSADARRQCDRDFLAAMRQWCDDEWSSWRDELTRRGCRSVAWLYYVGVRLFGGFGWSERSDASLV